MTENKMKQTLYSALRVKPEELSFDKAFSEGVVLLRRSVGKQLNDSK